jgi:Alkylmercury lyase
MDIDTSVKLKLYEIIVDTASMPAAADIATALDVPIDDVLAAFQRLYQKRLLVPEPGDHSRIRMAPPFSGVETTFLVWTGDKAYYANCVWDALGIPAALHRDARIEASDGHTGEPMVIEVREGKLKPPDRAPGDPNLYSDPLPPEAGGGVEPREYAPRDLSGDPYPGYFADPRDYAIHFAVPAARWWEDILHT